MLGSSPTTGTIVKNRVSAIVTRFFFCFQCFEAVFMKSITKHEMKNKTVKIEV